jgi:hypothetical protein
MIFPGSPAVAGGQLLFEKIRAAQTEHGPERVREVAEGFGLLLREEAGRTLLPLVVDRTVADRPGLVSRLAAVQGRVDARSRAWTRILVPLAHLEQLQALLPDVRLRTPLPALPAFGLGTNVSESVALVDAHGYQVGNLDGNGVRVAVVDTGFSNLGNAIAAGELPADACGPGRSQDFTGTGLQTGSVHGTGVAEHLIDMAPGVELHCLKVSDEVDLQNAAAYLATNGIDIASLSVSWAIGSYYDDSGPINDVINDSFDLDGKFWTVAAGNLAQRHWRGGWSDSNGNNSLEFSGSDERLALTGSAGTVTVFLNWNQYGVNKKTDLDLYVEDKNGSQVAWSTDRQTRFNDPVEGVSFAYQSAQAPYSIRVVLASGSTAGLDLTLFSFNHNFEYQVGSSSMMDPSVAHGAFTLGAVSQSAWPNTNPNIRSYSSQGPTNDGRTKPDLVAPDGTASLTYPTANGTSFSTPTTAGAAALLLQEAPARSAADLRTLLMSQAIDIRSVGIDNLSGAGKLQLPLIDSDGEGLNNVEEIALGTDALLADTDGDNLSDFDEDRSVGTDPLVADTDSDSLNDGDEVFLYSTSPLLADTDADGLDDGYEVLTYGSDPLTSNRGDLAPRAAVNNSIDAGDYVVLERLVGGTTTATAEELLLGDLNDSGVLDAGDLVLLLRVIQGDIALP